jgi:hypothetical protein
LSDRLVISYLPNHYFRCLYSKTMNRKPLPFLLILCLALWTACSEPAPKEIPDSEINAWFDAEYEELLQMSPIEMTTQGRKDRYGEIDDMSESAEDKRLAWMEARR